MTGKAAIKALRGLTEAIAVARGEANASTTTVSVSRSSIKPKKAWAGVRNGVVHFVEFYKATAENRIRQEWQLTPREFEQHGWRVIKVMIVPVLEPVSPEDGKSDA